MKYVIFIITSFFLLGCGTKETPVSSSSSNTITTECQTLKDVATNSTNGATMVFCDSFSVTDGTLLIGTGRWSERTY